MKILQAVAVLVLVAMTLWVAVAVSVLDAGKMDGRGVDVTRKVT